MIDVSTTPFAALYSVEVERVNLLCAKLEAERAKVAKLRDALEQSVMAGKLPKECPHDAEPVFCDGCAFEREKAYARAWLVGVAALKETAP